MIINRLYLVCLLGVCDPFLRGQTFKLRLRVEQRFNSEQRLNIKQRSGGHEWFMAKQRLRSRSVTG